VSETLRAAIAREISEIEDLVAWSHRVLGVLRKDERDFDDHVTQIDVQIRCYVSDQKQRVADDATVCIAVILLFLIRPRKVCRILVRGQCPLAARSEENFENLTTKWCILKYNYLNRYVVSIAPFSTPACPDCSQNIHRNLLFFCMFSLFSFSSIFQGVS